MRGFDPAPRFRADEPSSFATKTVGLSGLRVKTSVACELAGAMRIAASAAIATIEPRMRVTG
jgi:hypothetical protein